MSATRPVDVKAVNWVVGSVSEARQAASLAAGAFDPHFREAWTESQMAGLLSTADTWLEMGMADRLLLAFALCRQVREEVELLLCATGRDWRRMGLGRQLVGQVINRARRRGASRLFLEVRCSNDPAIGLYLACGFACIGKRPDYYRTTDGEHIDAMTLALDL